MVDHRVQSNAMLVAGLVGVCCLSTWADFHWQFTSQGREHRRWFTRRGTQNYGPAGRGENAVITPNCHRLKVRLSGPNLAGKVTPNGGSYSLGESEGDPALTTHLFYSYHASYDRLLIMPHSVHGMIDFQHTVWRQPSYPSGSLLAFLRSQSLWTDGPRRV